MDFYSYTYDLEEEDGEVFFVFGAFPEIISSISKAVYETWSEEELQAHAEDAVITALQAIISLKENIPAGDDPDRINAKRFVYLSPLHAMKLELAKIYMANCRTITQFARHIKKQDTAARRLLNLRHRSSTEEVIEALGHFGIILKHGWGTRQNATQSASPSLRPAAAGA